MVAVPAIAPVTVPPTTVALPLLLAQTPPVVASVSIVVLPVHTEAVAGVIATGAEFTVATVVTEQPAMA